MKLLNLRSLIVYSSRSIRCIDSLGYYSNCNTNYYPSIHLKCVRKCWSMTRYRRTTNKFRYEYESSDLLEKLRSSRNDSVISSAGNSVKIKTLLKNLSSQNVQSKEDVQAIVSSIILAAKYDQTVESIVEKAFGANAITKFLAVCDTWLDQMNADDVVSTLVALNLLKVPLHHPVNRKLTTNVTNMLRDHNEFPLKSLANLAIYSRENSDSIFPYMFCADGTSHILKYLAESQKLQDLHYVTIYLDNLYMILTREIMGLHKMKVKDLLNDIDPKTSHKEIFALLNFYRNNMTFKNTRIIRNLLLLMTNEVSKLSNVELRNIAWTRDWINEPASLIPVIFETAESRNDKSTDLNLLYCRLCKHLPEHSNAVSKDLLSLLKSMDAKDIIKNDVLYVVLKSKRFIYPKEIYQVYWDKVVQDLLNINTNHLEMDKILAQIAYRYCAMQKGMTQKHRNPKFETFLKELTLIEMKYGVSAWKPYRLSRLTTFLIGFACDLSTDFVTLPEHFVAKVEQMAPQFGFNETFDLSNGIDHFHRHGIPKTLNRRTAAKIADRIGRLENVLNECIERLLDERNSVQIDAICLLIKAYTNQKAPKQTRIVDKLVNKLKETCDSDEMIITTNTIQLAAGSLNRIYLVVPKLCERMLKFVNENMDIVGANTASCLLFYLFSMGYEPYREHTNSKLMIDRHEQESILADPDFDFATFIQMINRDFDFIPAWSIIQACLALSFYQALDVNLIQRVFNLDFVTRLEKEICSTFETRSYPRNILNLVMQLNRSVCLSYPEAGVPWFQQSFIEAQLASEPPKSSAYFNDIYKLLVSYVGGDKSLIRMNHVTPYGYRIPFVIYFNSNKQLVSPPFDEGPQTLNKVAILPLFNSSFRMNGTKELRGFDRLQERHLSMLGYTVIQICYREWNSIHMNLPGARENFLRNFLKKYKTLID